LADRLLANAATDPTDPHKVSRWQHILDKRLREAAILQQTLATASEAPPSLFSSDLADIQLVVWFYQQLGILPVFPLPEDYSYRDFVDEQGGMLDVDSSSRARVNFFGMHPSCMFSTCLLINVVV
jgi:hypothetical protein